MFRLDYTYNDKRLGRLSTTTCYGKM